MSEWSGTIPEILYTYVQDAAPAGAEEGETWYDLDGNAAYVYDGANWIDLSVTDHGQLSGIGASDHHTRYGDDEARQAVDGSSLSSLDINGVPITGGLKDYDAAKTFQESSVTVTTTDAEVRSGSVALKNGFTSSQIGVGDSTGDYGGGVEAEHGILFTAKKEIKTLDFDIIDTADTTVDTAYLRDHSDGSLLDSTSVSGAGDSATLTAPSALSVGSDYRLTADKSGNTYTPPRDQSAGFPVENDAMSVYDGYDGNSGGNWYNVTEIVTSAPTTTSGTATIEWPHPSDVYEWDIATFTRSPDNETVDVYVAYNDGSGWSRSNGGNPISRDYTLADDSSISNSDEIRVEADLSRADTSNDPTLDSVARSWRL